MAIFKSDRSSRYKKDESVLLLVDMCDEDNDIPFDQTRVQGEIKAKPSFSEQSYCIFMTLFNYSIDITHSIE